VGLVLGLFFVGGTFYLAWYCMPLGRRKDGQQSGMKYWWKSHRNSANDDTEASTRGSQQRTSTPATGPQPTVNLQVPARAELADNDDGRFRVASPDRPRPDSGGQSVISADSRRARYPKVEEYEMTTMRRGLRRTDDVQMPSRAVLRRLNAQSPTHMPESPQATTIPHRDNTGENKATDEHVHRHRQEAMDSLEGRPTPPPDDVYRPYDKYFAQQKEMKEKRDVLRAKAKEAEEAKARCEEAFAPRSHTKSPTSPKDGHFF